MATAQGALTLAAVGVLALGACSGARDAAAPSLPVALLTEAGGEAAVAPGLAALGAVAEQVQCAWAREPKADRIGVLNRVIFDDLGFVREVDDQDPRFMRLPDVLASRRGSCVGLGTLYLALGERLGLRLDGILVPGHFFVRFADGALTRNIELLRRGEEMPELWYRTKYGIPVSGAPAYLRPLSRAEVLAVVRFNLGNDHRKRERLEEAEVMYARAAAAFPAFAEAHASLGLVRQLKGDLAAAKLAYRAAQAANPHLPGVDRNLRILERESASLDPRPTAHPVQ